MKKGILFDLDGTLWHSAPGATAGFNAALSKLKKFDVRIDERDMMGFMGSLLIDIGRRMLPRGIDTAFLQKVVNDCCRDEMAYLRAHGAPLFEYAVETLNALKKDYSLYVVSNCQAGYIEIFLDYYGFWDLFDDYECPGRTGKLKADNIRLVATRNQLDRAVYIGDTNGDYLAATEAGVPFVHAAYGYGRPERKTPAVNCFADLPALLERML